MKKPLVLLGVLLAAPLAAQEPPRTQETDSKTLTVVMSVSGMTWPSGCPPAVRRALRSLPWVREAKVDYGAKAATVVVERKSYEADQLVGALEKAGFGGEVQPQDKKGKVHQNPAVTFHVIGMKKTKSGATWMGWPNKVTEALEGSHPTAKISWDYDNDKVTLAYDPKKTTPDQLAGTIKKLGYKVEVVAAPKAKTAAAQLRKVPVLKNAPAFFSDAIAKARKEGRPVVVDFWAEWCVPCKRLKKVTMADPKVAKVLEGVEVIFVDLDKHPELAKAFGVKSIPDVFFINAEGAVVDRLRKFEAVKPFLKRLEKLREKPSSRPKKKLRK